MSKKEGKRDRCMERNARTRMKRGEEGIMNNGGGEGRRNAELSKG